MRPRQQAGDGAVRTTGFPCVPACVKPPDTHALCYAALHPLILNKQNTLLHGRLPFPYPPTQSPQLTVDEYLAAKPDPVYPFSRPVCGHMNADHLEVRRPLLGWAGEESCGTEMCNRAGEGREGQDPQPPRAPFREPTHRSRAATRRTRLRHPLRLRR